MKHVVFTALAGAALMMASADSAEAANCKSLGYGTAASTSVSGAAASACMSIHRGQDFFSGHFISTHTKRHGTVLDAKISCSKFKNRSSNRQVRQAYDEVLRLMESNIKYKTDTSDKNAHRAFSAMLWMLENRIKKASPTYSCNRSGRTNNFKVEYRFD